jgi:RimJ/RimL family protein N-acetyltransferase
LTAPRVALRAIRRADVETLYSEFDTDPDLHAVVGTSAWRPYSLERALAQYDKAVNEDQPKSVAFAVDRVDRPDAAIGDACLWGINEHQRSAHLGITLVSAARGQGLGREVVDLLCRYGFRVRDLYRLQLETLASNQAMRATAKACGFVEEGRLRQASWVMGSREDDVLFGLLASEWQPFTD